MAAPRASRPRALVRRRCSPIAPAWCPQPVRPKQAQVRTSGAAAAAAGRAPQSSSREQLLAVWRDVKRSVAAWRPLLRRMARSTPCLAGGSLLRPPCSACGSFSFLRGSRHSRTPHRHRHLRSPRIPRPLPLRRGQQRRGANVTTRSAGYVRRKLPAVSEGRDPAWWVCGWRARAERQRGKQLSPRLEEKNHTRGWWVK